MRCDRAAGRGAGAPAPPPGDRPRWTIQDRGRGTDPGRRDPRRSGLLSISRRNVGTTTVSASTMTKTSGGDGEASSRRIAHSRAGPLPRVGPSCSRTSTPAASAMATVLSVQWSATTCTAKSSWSTAAIARSVSPITCSSSWAGTSTANRDRAGGSPVDRRRPQRRPPRGAGQDGQVPDRHCEDRPGDRERTSDRLPHRSAQYPVPDVGGGQERRRTSLRDAPMNDKMRIQFVNTATLPPLGADTWIHVQIMRHLDRSTHELHAACASGPADNPTPTYEALRQIPDLELMAVDFGPELSHRSRIDKVKGAAPDPAGGGERASPRGPPGAAAHRGHPHERPAARRTRLRAARQAHPAADHRAGARHVQFVDESAPAMVVASRRRTDRRVGLRRAVARRRRCPARSCARRAELHRTRAAGNPATAARL